MKKKKKAVTLAIGDGANDVGMIKGTCTLYMYKNAALVQNDSTSLTSAATCTYIMYTVHSTLPIKLKLTHVHVHVSVH